MPEQPIPEQDPITSKSYAAYYVIATVILVATLFWALWDEAWGQRPWKAFQEQWKTRYSAFLNTARSKSVTSEKDVEQNPDYAALKQAYDKTYQDSKAQASEARKAVDDASARLLAVQSVFTDRRAYVNALSYEIETSTSPSSKASKQKELAEYKSKLATVEFPDGSKKEFTFPELEETYNQIRDERTKLSLDLGTVLKPVTAAKAKMDEYISDHMVDLTPAQIDGLKKKDGGLGSGDRADQRSGSEYCRPVRVLPHGIARAAEDYRSRHDVEGREEAGCVRGGVCEPY